MTKQEERIIERLTNIQTKIATRNPRDFLQSSYVLYNSIVESLDNVMSAMRSYGMDPEQHNKFKTTLCKLVECIERETRIEALEMLKGLVTLFEERGHFGLCWQIYCTVEDIHKPRLREILPAHLQSAVTLMT